ncbi:hypothetical protein PybrP1_011149 [[Pythium] brassicae (nom. inval.)]|nr:hypothetical protein PybrP1_011149 [[Pythium] brassicae (nom. inval.)]
MTSLLTKSPRKHGYGSTDDPSTKVIALTGSSASNASFLSRLLFSYATPKMQLGNERQLNHDDLWTLEGDDEPAEAFRQFNEQFERHHKSVLSGMWHSYARSLLLCGIATAFSVACTLFAPQVLHHVIGAIAAPAIETTDLVIWLGAFFASRPANVVVAAQMNFHLQRVVLRLTVALNTLIFTKAMKRSIQSKSDAKAIAISNLYSPDVSNVMWAAFKINNLWIMPVQIAVIVFMLYNVIGLAAFAGLGAIGLSMFASIVVAKIAGSIYKTMAVSLDRISEFLAMEEYEPQNVDREPSAEPADVAIAVRDGTFGWSKDAPLLTDVNLEAKKGDLVVVHGSVGSGKSSLAFAPKLSPCQVAAAHEHETEESKAAATDAGRLVVDEEREEGRVSNKVFMEYFRALGGLKVCFLLLLGVFYQLAKESGYLDRLL